jgi:hypothetical protein
MLRCPLTNQLAPSHGWLYTDWANLLDEQFVEVCETLSTLGLPLAIGFRGRLRSNTLPYAQQPQRITEHHVYVHHMHVPDAALLLQSAQPEVHVSAAGILSINGAVPSTTWPLAVADGGPRRRASEAQAEEEQVREEEEEAEEEREVTAVTEGGTELTTEAGAEKDVSSADSAAGQAAKMTETAIKQEHTPGMPYPLTKAEIEKGWNTLMNKSWLQCHLCDCWRNVPKSVHDVVGETTGTWVSGVWSGGRWTCGMASSWRDVRTPRRPADRLLHCCLPNAELSLCCAGWCSGRLLRNALRLPGPGAERPLRAFRADGLHPRGGARRAELHARRVLSLLRGGRARESCARDGAAADRDEQGGRCR